MKQGLFVALLILLNDSRCAYGQVGGNIGYADSGGKARAEHHEQAKRVVTKDEMPPTGTSTFVESNVLMNVKADEYVVVFGISREGKTLAECSEEMEATIRGFSASMQQLGIKGEDLFVDFAAQTKTYGFEAQADILQEKLVGFELKKNVSIHYTDESLFEKITLAAARSQIFDLIKVDYVVRDIAGIQDKLMEEAAAITRKKISRYEKLLGIRLQPPAQVYAEKFATYYPTQMYDSYVANESEAIEGQPDLQKYTIKSARKSKTFFFNGLSADGFDGVINPVVTEPVVQFTLYLKVKYEVEQIKAK